MDLTTGFVLGILLLFNIYKAIFFIYLIDFLLKINIIF